jgi:hypothetical protein
VASFLALALIAYSYLINKKGTYLVFQGLGIVFLIISYFFISKYFAMISMIVAKAVKMAQMLNIDVLGVVENMSYIQCPDCDKKIKLFEGKETDKFLEEMNLKLLGELPMTKEVIQITHNGVDDISEELDNTLTSILNNVTTQIENLK